MTDKVFGSFTPLETKQDVPGAGAGYASDYLITAPEMNNQADLINQMRAAIRTGRLADISTSALSSANEKTSRVLNGRLQISVNGSAWHTVATSGVFCLRDYVGGEGDGATDNSAAIDAALDDCAAYFVATGNIPTLFFHQGVYLYSKPHFVSKVSLLGESKGSVLFKPVSSPITTRCFPFMGLPRLDNGYAYGPEALGAYHTPGLVTGSTSMYADYHSVGAGRSGNFFFDLSQSFFGRLPLNTPWTINFDRKLDSITAFQSVFSISGIMYTGERPGLLNITTPDGVQIKLQFRYNGLQYDITAAFTGQPTPTLAGVRNNFEVSWDGTHFRLFLNGELWTRGAYTPTGGAGTPDTTGMQQFAWEHMTIGSGNFAFGYAEEIGGNYAPGYWDNFHFSGSCRHTASFTPATTKPTADGNTLMLIDFSRRYKGCLVAQGPLGGHDIYLYPWVNDANDPGPLSFRNLSFFTGHGLWAEFAATLRMEEVSYTFPEDGIRCTRNGYYSHFRNMDIIGAGRVAFSNQAGSYVDLIGIKASGRICYLLNGSNLFGININASVDSYTSIGLFATGGSVEIIGFNIDAEVAGGSTPWMGAVHTYGMVAMKLSSPTLYNPTDKRVNDSIIWANRTPTPIDSTIIYDNPTILGSSAAPLIYTFGTDTYLVRPIILRSPAYLSPCGSVCNIPQNVVDPDAMAGMIRFGTAAPTQGPWPKGAITINIGGTSGSPWAWRCDVAGTPGTWISLGNIP